MWDLYKIKIRTNENREEVDAAVIFKASFTETMWPVAEKTHKSMRIQTVSPQYINYKQFIVSFHTSQS